MVYKRQLFSFFSFDECISTQLNSSCWNMHLDPSFIQRLKLQCQAYHSVKPLEVIDAWIYFLWQQKKWKHKLAPKQIFVWFLKFVAANLLSRVSVDSNDGQLIVGPDLNVTVIWWSALNFSQMLGIPWLFLHLPSRANHLNLTLTHLISTLKPIAKYCVGPPCATKAALPCWAWKQDL